MLHKPRCRTYTNSLVFLPSIKELTQTHVVAGFKDQFDRPQETHFGVSGRQAA